MLTPDILLRASEVDGLDATNLLLGRGGNSASGSYGGRTHSGVDGRDKGASLDSRRRQLAAQRRAKGLREASGCHDYVRKGGGDGE